MDPPKYDIKGFDFKKATTSEFAEEFFMSLIKKYVLADGDINVKGILKELNTFKENIYHSLQEGERKFLKNGNAKELSAYKFPEREQSVRGTIAWNILNPSNMIELPAKVSLVTLNLITEKDCAPLEKSHPEIYQLIMKYIFNDETGIFVQSKYEDDTIRIVNPRNKKWYESIPKKYRAKYKKLGASEWNDFAEKNLTEEQGHYEYKKQGLQVLAIPSNSLIPEWVRPYIDYTTTINNILSPFNPLLRIFKLPTIEEGKTIGGVNRKSERFSNIIKF